MNSVQQTRFLVRRIDASTACGVLMPSLIENDLHQGRGSQADVKAKTQLVPDAAAKLNTGRDLMEQILHEGFERRPIVQSNGLCRRHG